MGRKKGRSPDPLIIDQVLEDLEIDAIMEAAAKRRAEGHRSGRRG